MFLSLNQGQVTAELIHKEHKATIRAYMPTTAPRGSDCGDGGREQRRWYHAEVTVTADSVRLSVNHQPATEQSVGVDVVAMLERLTIGGGTASGERIANFKTKIEVWLLQGTSFRGEVSTPLS